MRTSERIIFALILGATPVAAPAFAFDGAPATQDTAIPVLSAQPNAATALKKVVPPSTSEASLTSLQYAAEGGHPIAQWKLGRMYADGDGVAQNDLQAFDYFSRIANAHAEDSPSAPQAAIVANAFVALGRYYLNGIPNSKIKSDPERAREMFSYAASYFGNADAQYDLARLYLKSAGSSRDDFRYGARWLGLAAQKGQHQAQAMLGQMLFTGEEGLKPTDALSGGETARLLFCRIMLQKPNVLVLDEPTNHLDLESINALNIALQKYEGTVFLVTHDEDLMEEVGTRVWHFDGKTIQDFKGTYEEYAATLA